MEYHIMVFQTFCKHFAVPAIRLEQIFFQDLFQAATLPGGASLLAMAACHSALQ
jgi:hypothetical protein